MALCLLLQALLLYDLPLAASVLRATGQSEVGDAVALLQARALPPSSEDHPEALWQALESDPPASSESFRQTLVNFGDAQYVAYMALGRQMIAGILDTGSYDLVVFGVDCRTCGVASHFNHHLSRSYWESPVSVEQFYGSGRALANAARERVAIGPYRIANQSFWNVKYAQMPVLNGAAFEAIFGLGPPDTPIMNAWTTAEQATAEVLSYFDQGLQAPSWTIEAAQRAVEAANDATRNPPLLSNTRCTRFSVCLGARSGADGVLVWNDTLAQRRPELFVAVPVVGDHSWSVDVSNAGLGFDGARTSEVLACADGCRALVDSGTSILSAPAPVVEGMKQAFMKLNPACSNLEVLPDLVFEVQGKKLSLPPDSYVAMVVEEHTRFLEDHQAAFGYQQPGWQCQMLIRETDASSTAGPLWILGMPFFRRYYTTFDLGTNGAGRQLHFAPHSQDDCEPSTASEVAKTYEHQLRRVSLNRLRFR